MKISDNAMDVLIECTVEEQVVFLPPRQLDRKLYEEVNKCLTNMGGKWNRKSKGHVFDYDPADALVEMVSTGETESVKKTFQFFPTPKFVAERMCSLAELKGARRILEPSAGRGDLADVIYSINPNLLCRELNNQMDCYLGNKPYPCVYGDFMAMDKMTHGQYDRIVMNPPFSKQQDVDHVMHAYDLLESGGILVSVMCLAPFFRNNIKSVEFRDWLNNVGAEVFCVDAGSFKESGTIVETKIVRIHK